ncbi:S1C family serine protease [Bacillus solimangrovi]|uniref:Serine protease n=1 Tax=Bacillus solimangrovi TaxID=1305675 RepID=A0A1E5LG83_9BACI|nr:trypsin-like peptidase domain-containing protein [Bacillus solimangrovi]OEH93082.1 serine protease [Bacillus solimangrovi]
MGYYDEDYEDSNRKQKGNRGGVFLPAILGAVLGALIVLFASPALSNWGLIPNNTGEGTVVDQEQKVGETTTLNVNVETAITDAVDKALPSVVGVVNIQEVGFWEQQGATEAGTGSGVIYKKEGDSAFVVTNDHVVKGATKLEVSLSDGSRIPAELVGSDVYTDLAVLRIDGSLVNTVAEFGSSENIKIGEPVVAIGNPLGLQFAGSVTRGIISGKERSLDIDLDENGQIDWQAEVIQTDAAINPGNSGGALVNLDGQVIGINSMKIAQQEVEGIGFSIPVTSVVKPIIADLEQHGEVKRPFIGISMRSLSEIPSYHWQETLKLPQEITKGVFIVEVVPGSPAIQAGLKEFDVITQLDGQDINDLLELRKYLYSKKNIGDTMTITYYRSGEKKEGQIRLAEEPKY